jgi:hypothetical protein
MQVTWTLVGSDEWSPVPQNRRGPSRLGLRLGSLLKANRADRPSLDGKPFYGGEG